MDKEKNYWLIIAQIDYWYFIISSINKEIKGLPPINRMIDDVTGYSKERDKNWRKETIRAVKQIIKLKKEINEDFLCDKKFLNKLTQPNPKN